MYKIAQSQEVPQLILNILENFSKTFLDGKANQYYHVKYIFYLFYLFLPILSIL